MRPDISLQSIAADITQAACLNARVLSGGRKKEVREKSPICPKGQRGAQFECRPTTRDRGRTSVEGGILVSGWDGPPFFSRAQEYRSGSALVTHRCPDCFNSPGGKKDDDRAGEETIVRAECNLTCKCSTWPRYLRRSLDSDPIRCPRTSGTGKWPQGANRSRGREHVSPVPSCGTCGRAILLQNWTITLRSNPRISDPKRRLDLLL